MAESSILSDTLRKITERIWSIDSYKENIVKSNESTPSSEKPVVEYIEDDRDNWLVEIKINSKRHVLSRIESEPEIEKYIIYLMTLGKFSGYQIWSDYDNYKEF